MFFRDILDRAAIARLKRRFLDVLERMEMIDPGADDPVWNGRSLEGFPEKIEALHQQRTWRRFVAEPAINAFFARVLGSPPFWIPSVEYRITPPARARSMICSRVAIRTDSPTAAWNC
ncbi:MAG: hypothetical protein WDN44_03730 [Sphingomonas sp.]